ncbi:MAG: nicotinamide-nucleotide amidohydrolase family protein [Clostridia bacterium]|nr:nicotinamide-nucleotide amidohydrolase family protein [Clostridia bacterium]
MKKICMELFSLLKKNGLSLATAESCTGGLVAKTITDVSGASEVFLGGVVSYQNDIKINVLGVSKSTIDAYSEVSFSCAEEMALGICKVMSSNIGISTTGFAGPTGGTEKDPVGTVYIGIAVNGDVSSHRLSLGKGLSRDKIRKSATKALLLRLLEKIKEKY